jgi:hypothetical protein
VLRYPTSPKSGSAFPSFTAGSEARWAALEEHIVLAWRSPRRRTESFADDQLIRLSDPTLVVMRHQHTLRPDSKRAQRSVILLLLKLFFNVPKGEVFADAQQDDGCCSAVYDCALPRHLWGEYPHYLDPAHNKTAAGLATLMSREVNRVLDAGEPVSYQPTLPEFYMAFVQRPVFERGAILQREASAALGKAADDITNGELEEYFWSQTFETNGFLFVPQRYLARQGDYPVHPIDGSARPTNAGFPMQWQGQGPAVWYFDDGRWNPAAQRPHSVYARMSHVLGRPFRNPAFAVLKSNGFFPADMSYPQFMATPSISGLHQQLADALDANSTIADLLVASMRQALGSTGEMASDDDLLLALDQPNLPMNLSFATSVRALRVSGLRADALTWRLPGVRLNGFSAKRVWEADWRVQPVSRMTGSHEYGRASVTHAD